MINVIHGAGVGGFDAILYPETHIANRNYFQNQVSNFGNTLNDFGRNFMEAARNVYEQINSSEAMHLARVAIRAAKGVFNPNQILEFRDLVDFHAATPTMQRWVMASPCVRDLYHQQRCDGYADSYNDIQPGIIGEQHYDYRRVMDGVIQETGDDGWMVKFYPDELREGENELDHHQKVAILRTWDIAEMFIKRGEDITNPYGGKL